MRAERMAFAALALAPQAGEAATQELVRHERQQLDPNPNPDPYPDRDSCPYPDPYPDPNPNPNPNPDPSRTGVSPAELSPLRMAPFDGTPGWDEADEVERAAVRLPSP